MPFIKFSVINPPLNIFFLFDGKIIDFKIDPD
jgi:hypothetical protein